MLVPEAEDRSDLVCLKWDELRVALESSSWVALFSLEDLALLILSSADTYQLLVYFHGAKDVLSEGMRSLRQLK